MPIVPTRDDLADFDLLRDHPLRQLLEAAARGSAPAADGSVDVVEPPYGPVDAVLAFNAHHVVAARVDPAAILARLDPGDLGSPMTPSFLAWLSDLLGVDHPPTLDVVLAASAIASAGSLDEMIAVRPMPPDLRHRRVRRAAAYRGNLRVWETWNGDAVLIVGRGLAGRWEVAFEVEPESRGRGIGRALAAAARRMIPEGEYVFAQVAPGNVASLRALLAAGYVPIGAEVLFLRR
jgi:GNAT superfamily N-acetyltransferase